ncbi:serine/threonine protein phosphatase PrpC [Natronobacillus azotifigens]|uniref:Protein phosphatase 2C domain-containing protein n=1 Tax=Natronobacillus azotifigens TaxID=472978 RepID=A0A9J6RBS5_9BACI|nr:protein phosphatase 2C domain-containing protein [Natronobacillus azotifigens]MCZ0703146.1 protein phosphatase 2C domain-containing protein [Natronobacillus azotifigens]
MFQYGIATDRGNVKMVNEDHAFLRAFTDKTGLQLYLAIVADGMGGHARGDYASQWVIQQLNEKIEATQQYFFAVEHPFIYLEEALKKWVQSINTKLYRTGVRLKQQIGTTLSVLVLFKERFLLIHVGDSRIYQRTRFMVNSAQDTMPLFEAKDETDTLVSPYLLKQLTEDHTWVREKVKRGELRRDKARLHPKSNLLVDCIGITDKVMPHMEEGRFSMDDIFVLCTDGFYENFTDDQILADLTDNDLNSQAEYLVNKAKSAGTRDNITVLLIKPGADGRKRKKRSIFN